MRTKFLFFTLVVLLVLSSLLLSGIGIQEITAQPGELTQLEYVHTVEINGIVSQARSTGAVDMATGTIVIDGFVENYIDGYRFWPTSWLTLIIISSSPVVALERAGASNLFTLTNGELGYAVEVTTQDPFAEITTNIAVRRNGDTLVVALNSVGSAEEPDIVDMGEGPRTLFQTPNPEGEGFTEQAVKQLVTADGEVIESSITARYQGVSLPSPQRRDVNVTLLSESEDRQTVALQYDTTVQPDRAVQFGGLLHRPLGEASLDVTEAGLVVASNGNGDQDGVSIVTGESEFLITTLEQLVLPDAAAVQVSAFGEVDGRANQRMATTQVQSADNGSLVTFDFTPLGVQTQTVQVYLDGELVDSIVDVEAPEIIIVTPEGCTFDPVWPMNGDIWSILEFPTPAEIILPGRDPVEGDRIVAIAETPPREVGAVAHVDIQTQNLPQFTIKDQALGAFDLLHRAQGQASMLGTADGLVLGNIGSSGADGVSVDFAEQQGAVSFAATFDADLENAEPGSFVELRARGPLEGQSDAVLVSGRVSAAEDGLTLARAEDSLNAESEAVIILQDGEPVEIFTDLPPGTVVRAKSSSGDPSPQPSVMGVLCPLGIAELPDWIQDLWLDILWINWDDIVNPVPFEIISQGDVIATVEGDSVWFAAQGDAVERGPFHMVDLRAAGTPSLLIREENVAAPDLAAEQFGGIRHRPLQNTELQASADALRVTPIVAENPFGVDIDTHESEFLITTLSQMDPSVLPTGAAMDVRATGQADGQSNQPLVTLRVEDVGEAMQAQVDFSALNVISQTVVIFDEDGVELDRLVDVRDPIITIPTPSGCIIDPVWAMDDDIWTLIDFPAPVSIAINERTPVVGSRVAFIAEDPPVTVGSLSNVNIVARQMPSFSILDEAVGMFELPHRSLGQAALRPVGGNLTVSNIGSSGEDGVSVGVGTAVEWIAELTINPNAEAGMQLTAIGGDVGEPVGPASSLFVQDADSTAAFSTTFGSPTYRMQIFDGDELVLSRESIPNGTQAASYQDFLLQLCQQVPEFCEFTIEFSVLPDTGECSWEIAHVAAVEITADDSTVSGDRIVLTENHPTEGSHSHLEQDEHVSHQHNVDGHRAHHSERQIEQMIFTEMQIAAFRIPSLTLSSESVQLQPASPERDVYLPLIFE